MAKSILSKDTLDFTSDGSNTLAKLEITAQDKLKFHGKNSGDTVTLEGIATPASSNDAANKSYVDSQVTASQAGLHLKAACRVATDESKTLATDFENGDTIDGITLATGNRILIKDQNTKTENGIYTVNASGAPTRATDFSGNTMLSGSHTFIQEGSKNADKGFVAVTDTASGVYSAITEIQFSQFSAGLTDITAGDLISISGTGTKTIQHDSAFISKIGTGTGVQIGGTAGGAAKDLTVASDSSVFTVGNSGTKKTVINGSGTITVGGGTHITSNSVALPADSHTLTVGDTASSQTEIKGTGSITVGGGTGTEIKSDSVSLKSDSHTLTVGDTATKKVVITGSGNITVGSGNTSITSSSVQADTVTSASDERLKTNIVEITDAVEKVKKLKGVHFSWKESGAADAGVIAQDVEQVCPHWVKENAEGIKSVDYSKLSSLLIQVVKEQQSDIDELKAAVAALQSA